MKLTIKIFKFLLKLEKWVLKNMDPDDVRYEEYCEIIKKNEKHIELLGREKWAGEKK